MRDHDYTSESTPGASRNKLTYSDHAQVTAGTGALLRTREEVIKAHRLVGNAAVARILQGVAPAGRLLLQRDAPTRAQNIAALKRELAEAAKDNTKWKDVAFRLNGFEETDIPRVTATLTVSQLLKTRAAVQQHLAGWPMQAKILAAIETTYARKITGTKGTHNRPLSSTMWAAYEQVDYMHKTLDEVWEHIGGSVGKTYGPQHGNSCAARVSWALNNGGYPVFGWGEENKSSISYKGKRGDGKVYIVWVPTLGLFLKGVWGPPDATLTTSAEVVAFEAELEPEQVAIFVGDGHAGLIRQGYIDPSLRSHLPALAWKLK